jgi:hypothetical protein
MALCPKCKRNSLEYNDIRKTAWCLYVSDCGFEKEVKSYDVYIQKYERVSTARQSDPRHLRDVLRP